VIGWVEPATSQVSDHLKCYKVKDSSARATYTADLHGLLAEPGCQIKVPGKLLCVGTPKTNVQPSPPGAGAGTQAGRFLCYKLKCPQAAWPPVDWADQFGARTLTIKVPKMLCAPEAAISTTTTTLPADCGNGMMEGSEECDDADAIETDGCTSQCVTGVICDLASYPGGDDFAVDPATGHCYVSFDGEQSTFGDAQGACVSSGGHLVTITGAAEDAVATSIQNSAENPWIGASDANAEGSFEWVTAEPWAYTRFAAGKPDGDGDCLHMSNAAGEWDDADCTFIGLVTGRICEFAPN
jgi:cysteine-rich repeat protein